MTAALYALLDAGALSPLSYYFARFVSQGTRQGPDSLLAQSAALVSTRNLQGDVCVDLRQFAGQPLFEAPDATGVEIPLGPDLATWRRVLGESNWVGLAGPDTPEPMAPLVLEGERLYLGKYWRFEQQVADALRQRLAAVEALDRPRLKEGLDRLFPDPGTGTTDWQRVAAAIAVSRRFAVISGGPGTGKTTTVVKVLTLLLEQHPELRIGLAAPTGKAAARLGESLRGGKAKVQADPEVLAQVPEEASTIHRLLGLDANGRPRHHRENPLLVDCLVVDEASMIDLPLMARLLDALPAAARLVLLGDRDQLASVEAGNVLGDITGHGGPIRYSQEQLKLLEDLGALSPDQAPPASHSPGIADAIALLQVSYRFPAHSGIGGLARQVNEGQGRQALDLLDPRSGFKDIAWIEAQPDRLNPACLDWAVQRYTDYLRQTSPDDALRAFERARVLTALRVGPLGAEAINRLIEERLRSLGLIRGGDDYEGKPVMVTANDYEVGLFNGDIGLLWRDDNQVLRAYFRLAEGQVRAVSVRQLPEHAPAYALTVHKSQGSEFDEVLLVLPHAPGSQVSRELIYTGITRAKQRVSIHGNPEAFITGCAGRVERSSALAGKLGWTAS